MHTLPRALLLASLLVVPVTAAAQDRHGDDDPKPGMPGKPPRGPWSVEDPGGPYRDWAFDADEGTWMSVDVSPDGKTVAFDLLGDIWSMPIEGGDARLLSGGLPWEVQPRWSPDGKRVLFTSDRGGGDNLWAMDPDGGNREPVTREDYRLFNNGNWHPGGRFVVGHKHFTSRRSLGAGEMWLVPYPEGGEGVGLTKRKNDQQDAGEPVFSPDGRFLYWSEDMSGGDTFQYNKDPHGSIYHVRRRDMETGETTTLLEIPGGAIRPQPSPDGKTLAFVRRERNESVLALFDLETGEVRDLFWGLSLDQQETWAIFGPYPGYSWTPDGTALVIWARGKIRRIDARNGKARILPFRARGTQRLLPTCRTAQEEGAASFDVKVVRWPEITADGKTAVFQALGRLYRRDLASGAVRRLTSAEGLIEGAPRLSPDGKQVVYVTWHDVAGGRVMRVPVEGGEPEVLVERPGQYVSAALSADGRDLVYHRSAGDGYRGNRFGEGPGIWRRHVGEPDSERFLTREGREPRFAPDGRRILLHAREGDKSALVSIDRIGSDRRVLVTSERAVDFALSPDGRWLAFEELWQAYVLPFPPGPGPVDVAPGMRNLPVVRLSRDAGTYLSWSPDSKMVRWSVGPDLFEARVADLYPRPRPGKEDGKETEEPRPADERGVGAPAIALGWSEPADVPAGEFFLVGGRILPMDDLTVIDDGVVHVRGNRIVSVGARDAVPVPEGAEVVDCSGFTLLPGLVDVHAHHGSSNGKLHAVQSWALTASLAFGVTTLHDPSNNTQMFFAEAEMVRAGERLGPRLRGTGTILYGAEGDFKAVVNSLEDARQEVRRTAAWGAGSVKSYQQPRREQRQQVLAAAREMGILVVPEGGSTLNANLSQILDGHTTIEHALPVAPLHEPELELFAKSGTAYTPTLVVGYGGLWGENWWYAHTRVWENDRLLRFVPRSVVDPRARRRVLATDEDDYHHFRLARTAAEIVRRGGLVEIGAHGQMQGLAAHWETWMLEQGGLSPHEALRCATWMGAKALGLDGNLGSLRPGMLADLIAVDGNVLENVRDSERVIYTVANGRLFDARVLEQILPERKPLPAGPPVDSLFGGGDHAEAPCACGR